MTERILYLVRHGESDFDSADFVDGPRGPQWNPPLSARGREQARLLAERLRSMSAPVAVHCSTLRRARETVAPYAEASGVDVTFDDDLAEAYLGDWEGKRFEDILAADEEMLHRIRNQEPIWRHAPSVEELDAFRARVRDAVERAVSPRQEGNVVIVCHGAVINAYVAPLVGVDHEMFFVPENASLNSVVIDGDRRRVRFLNDALHLSDPHLFSAADTTAPR